MQGDSEVCSKGDDASAEVMSRATGAYSIEVCSGQPLQQMSTTVFVGGQHKPLPYHITSAHLRQHFKEFNKEISNVVMARSPKPRGFGLVTFKSESAAARAIEQLEGSALLGKFQVHLDFYQKKKNHHKDESKTTQSLLPDSSQSGSSCSYSASSHDRDPKTKGAAVQQQSTQLMGETSMQMLTTVEHLSSKSDVTLLTSTAKKASTIPVSSESGVCLPGNNAESDKHVAHCGKHQEHAVLAKALDKQPRENPGVLDLALPTKVIESSSPFSKGNSLPQPKYDDGVGALVKGTTSPSASESLHVSSTEGTGTSHGTGAQKCLPELPKVHQVLPYNTHERTTGECLAGIGQIAGGQLAIPEANQEIVHCVHVGEHQSLPACSESVDSESTPLSQAYTHELMSFDLYMFIKARCHAAVQDFVAHGGKFEHENGKAIVSAPSQKSVDSFIHSTVSSFKEFLLKLDTRQWNRFMSVGDQGKTLLTDLSVPFAGNPDLRIVPVHDRLAVLLVGRESVVFQAQQHFSATLDKEIPIETLKMEALIHLHPSLQEDVMRDTGAQLEGFHQGSTMLSLNGHSQCVGRAKKYIEVLVGKFQCEKVPFPYVSVLAKSAQRMLRMLKVKAYLSTPAVCSSTSIVNELEVCAFSLVNLNEAVKLVRTAPLQDCVHMPPAADRSKGVTTHCSHLEKAFSVSIQLPTARTPQHNRIGICGYVVNDIKEVAKALEGIIKNTPVTIPLKCNEIQSSYLRHILSSPTAETRALIGSLPAQVSCLDNVITLTGTCDAVDAAQGQLLQSYLLQELFGHTYTYRHNIAFLPQIEMHVLTPMRTRMSLEVTCCHEKMGSYFTVSIFSNKEADFKAASQLMKVGYN